MTSDRQRADADYLKHKGATQQQIDRWRDRNPWGARTTAELDDYLKDSETS